MSDNKSLAFDDMTDEERERLRRLQHEMEIGSNQLQGAVMCPPQPPSGLMMPMGMTIPKSEWTDAKRWKCKCGAPNEGKFCTECGSPAPPPVWFCPDCGERNQGKFCTNCGAKRPSEEN